MISFIGADVPPLDPSFCTVGDYFVCLVHRFGKVAGYSCYRNAGAQFGGGWCGEGQKGEGAAMDGGQL